MSVIEIRQKCTHPKSACAFYPALVIGALDLVIWPLFLPRFLVTNDKVTRDVLGVSYGSLWCPLFARSIVIRPIIHTLSGCHQWKVIGTLALNSGLPSPFSNRLSGIHGDKKGKKWLLDERKNVPHAWPHGFTLGETFFSCVEDDVFYRHVFAPLRSEPR